MQNATDLNRDMETIAERLRQELLSPALPSDEIQESLQQLNQEGCWPDVDYADRAPTHWSPSAHTHRLSALARAYRKPGGQTEGSEALKKAILSGLKFWVDQDPQSDNWWFNCIDTPKYLGYALLLMGDEVPREILRQAEQIIRRSSFKRTGANLTWEAGNLMVLACVIGDVELLRQTIEQITKEIRITTEEGVQPDFSFHQHGPQLYMSNYGEVFSGDNSRYAVLFAGTSFALGEEKIRALSGLIREGQQWFIWGRQFDYHALGRQLDSPGATYRGRGFAQICERMRAADPEHAGEYRNFAARASGGQQPGETGPRGNRHYWRSDVMVHRPGRFYVSVRMHSTRTYATEVRVNRENLKGYHLSDGAYFLMQRGDEYHDIQPVWDWRKLPGVTCRETDEPFPYGRDVPAAGNTTFVGGVSDGRMGAAAMDYAKDGVRARKAWFFTDAGWVCLGAGIVGETDHRVTTSVNQCLLKSDVSILQGAKVTPMSGQRLEGGNVQGVHHDGVGYALLEPHRTVVSAGPQSGTWTSIEERSSRHETVTQDVFSLWIDHGIGAKDPRYAYLVAPGMDAETFASFADKMPVQVISNSAEQQAVHYPDQKITQAVCDQPGRVEISGEAGVTTDTPCLLMLRRNGDTLEMSVADPTQECEQIELKLDGRYAGDGCAYEADNNVTVVPVVLPQQEFAGKTVQVTLRTQP